MADEVAPAAAPATENGEQPQQQSFFQQLFGFASRMMMMWMIMNFFKGGNKAPVTFTSDASAASSNIPSNSDPTSNPNSNPLSQMPANFAIRNSFNFGDHYNLFIYLTENESYHPDDPKLIDEFRYNFIFGNWEEDQPEAIDTKFTLPDSVRLSNGTLFLHAFFTEPHVKTNPEKIYNSGARKSGYRNFQLTPYKKLKKHKRTANLLTGKTDIQEEDILEDPKLAPIIPHWHRNMSLNIVYDVTPFSSKTLVPPLDTFIKFSPDYRTYEPTFFFNPYWNLQRDYFPINETVTEVDFNLQIYPLSIFKFQMYAAQLNQKNFMKEMLGSDLAGDSDGSDQDSLKEMFLDNNIYLVITTFIVSILHMIFEFLAFKNDIQFWNKKKEGKDLEGLSIRAVMTSIGTSVIVFLYVLDNDANWMVIFNLGIGMLIDFWKIKKVLNIYPTGSKPENSSEAKEIEDQDGPKPWKIEVGKYTIEEYAAYRESPTKEYDRMAFRYLGYIIAPLFVCYAIYSVIYNEFRSWYSFVLSLLY